MNIYPLLTWYLLISLVGWLTLPLIHQLFSGLGDRGYVFARILGLLLWAYVFWLLASLGILPNEPGSILLALLIIILISGWSIRKTGLKVVGAWIRQNMKLILVVELLFLFAFLGMAAIRAANPDIVGTEKPMELAFINATRPLALWICHLLLLFWLCDGRHGGQADQYTRECGIQFGSIFDLCFNSNRCLWDGL
jgi:hypothetical protein